MTLKLAFAGFNYVADVDGSYSADSLTDMKNSTASNSVALTDDYGINAATSQVYADYSAGMVTGNTETIAAVTATAKEAESKGLTVMFRPLLDFTADATPAMLKSSDGTQYANGDWRAYYKPTDIAAFFSSYDTMIVAQAKAAQASGAQLFDVGTEIDQLTGSAYLSYWKTIIGDIRAVYTGKLTYSAISDDDLSPWQFNGGKPAAGSGNLATQVSFWSLLDYVGIDEYAAISDKANPTVADLVAGWEAVPTDPTSKQTTGGVSLIQYYESVATAIGKPLLFTELGYNSAPDAASQPFYTSSATYDPTLQTNLYKAFFQAWQEQGNTSLQGVYLWNWEPDPATVGVTAGPNWTPQQNVGAIQAVATAFTAATATVSTTTDAYAWIGTAGGDWGTATYWADTTTATSPAATAPGANDPVTIAGGAGPAQAITGSGTAATLAVTGLVTLNGTFGTGAITVGTAATDATLTDSKTLTASAATIVDGTLAVGAGGSLTVAGAVTLGGSAATNANDYQTLSVTGGGAALVGSLVLGKTAGLYVPNYVTVDAMSVLAVGSTAAGAAAGTLTVQSGATLSGTGTIAAAVTNAGTIQVQGGTLYVQGALQAGGTTQIGAGSTLDAQSATGTITFAGAGGTLVLHAAPKGTGVAGLVAGDTIDLAGIAVTSTSYAPSTASSGVLTLFNGTATVGTMTLAGAYTGTEFLHRADAAGTGTALTVGAAPNDFNGDGTSDLLLQNDNGNASIFALNGVAVSGTASLGNAGAGWHIMGSADFNGDGQTDILLQNDDGSVVDYLMHGTTITAGTLLASPGANWHVRGMADFNGDGRADIVMQSDSGSLVLWDTNGSAITAGYALAQLPAGWSVQGVADFNGDGIPDILVQSTAGTLVDYTMAATGIASTALIGNPGAGWSVGGTGDYNGDGRADLMLHNDAGSDVVWDLNGPTIIGSKLFAYTGPAYQATLAGIDLNADGKTDVVVQGNDSSLVGWEVDSTASITAGAVLNTPGAGWHLVGSTPTTFINGTPTGSEGATLTATAGRDQFNLTSSSAGLHTIMGFDPAQDTVALSAAFFGAFAGVAANEASYMGGTVIALSANAASVVWIQGVTPSQLGTNDIVLR